MVDKEMLEAISQMMDAKLATQRENIMRDVVTLMDAEFKPKFDLLAEELKIIKDRLPDPDILEKMQDELDLHHAMLRKHTREIQNLKKAQ